MDHTNQWTTQEINGGLRGSSVGMGIMGEMASSSSTSASSLRQAIAIGSSSSVGERKLGRPQKDEVQNCPRCHSTNTKFCYYNNYSLTQPRYFCKGCRRYWTAGGTLRNVPVGGGSRKNKHRSSSTSSSSATTSSSISHQKLINIPDLNPPNHHIFPGNPNQDLNLGFPPQSQHHHLYQFELPKFTDNNNHRQQLKSAASPSTTSGTNTPTATTPFAALEFLRSTYSTAPPADTNGIYSSHTSGFSFQELKPAGVGGGSFSVDDHHGLGSSVGGIHEENGRRLMFPFGGLMKQAAAPSRNANDQVHHDDDNNNSRGGHAQLSNSNGFWNGMIGGGGGGGSW